MEISRRNFLRGAAVSAVGAAAIGVLPQVSAFAEGGQDAKQQQSTSALKPMMAVQQIMIGTLTGTEEKALQTLAAIKAAGYEGIELNSFMIHPTSFAVKMMTQVAGMPIGDGGKLDWPSIIAQSGMKVPSLHQYLDSIESDPDSVIDECATYGTDTVVLTGMYRYDYSDTESVRSLASRLNAAGKTLAEGGIQLLYHNHNCEFLRLDTGDSAYHLIQDETDPAYVGFEFDSYWCAECGADPILEMQRLGSRLKLHHINDRGTRQNGVSMTPILTSNAMELGTGTMPLKELIAIDEAAPVKAIVLETHQNWINNSPIESLQMSAEFLKQNI